MGIEITYNLQGPEGASAYRVARDLIQARLDDNAQRYQSVFEAAFDGLDEIQCITKLMAVLAATSFLGSRSLEHGAGLAGASTSGVHDEATRLLNLVYGEHRPEPGSWN